MTSQDACCAISQPPWFEYVVKAHPHHTDYAGIVWHGTYLTWMEEARVELLRSIGVEFADLVALGCNLPVVDISIRYHRSLSMGERAVVRCRMGDRQGVRLPFDYEIFGIESEALLITACVTLVPTDMEKGKILRRLPQVMEDALAKLS
jgi:acyl-CoA thioester hydrolase